MVSLNCAICNTSNFKVISTLHLHFQVCHKSCKLFLCSTDNCKRTFDKRDSFRKHLVKQHRVPLHNDDQMSSDPPIVSPDIYELHHDVENISDQGIKQVYDEISDGNNSAEQNQFLLKDFKSLLADHADVLVAKMYSKPGLPRSLIDGLIQDFSNFMAGPFLKELEKFVLSAVENSVASEVTNKMCEMFKVLSDPFSHLSSEYLRFKHFETAGEYIPPVKFCIDSRMERVTCKEGVKFQMKEVTGQFIPLRKVLKKFFELPGVFDDILSSVNSVNINSDLLSDFSQSEIWKLKLSKFPQDQLVIPMKVYYDDFEPNAALGPHSEKLGACYISLPCLPPECRSKLENIFLALLFNADDRSSHSNKKCFKPLLEELLFLETEGITVTIAGKETKIYCVTGLILGDNLGLNGLCGFVESFSANHVCRICRASKELSSTLLEKDVSLLRTKENYVQDVNLNNSRETGIKEESICTVLPSNEMPCDIGVDEFHDAAEGVCQYTMIPVLRHFQAQDPFFIETLNNRMYACDLGDDSDNRPPSISIEKLASSKKLKMTGAETYTFVRYFGVWVWDLVRDDDQYYQLYLLLKDIVTIGNSKLLPRDAHVILAVKVKEHHKLYMALTGETLKPKHHNLIHYPRLLLFFGPIGLLSTIRFEAKHKILKMTSNTCMSRRNLAMTVAIRQQLALCYRFVSNEPISPKFIIGSGSVMDLKEMKRYLSFSLTLPDEIFYNSTQYCAKWVEFKGTKYRVGHVVMSGTDENGCYLFCEIQVILSQCQPLFICSPMITVGYHCNAGGYEVEKLPDAENWYCLSPEDLLDPFPLCPVALSTGELIIVPKRFL